MTKPVKRWRPTMTIDGRHRIIHDYRMIPKVAKSFVNTVYSRYDTDIKE